MTKFKGFNSKVKKSKPYTTKRRSQEDCKCIKLSFDVEAKAKQSVRKSGDRFHKDPKVEKYEKIMKSLTVPQLRGQRHQLTGPIYYDAVYTFKYPKNLQKWAKDAIDEGKTIYKATKPDLTDNLNKGIIDAISPLFMENDSRIAYCTIKKVYGVKSSIVASFYELPQG